MAAGTAHDGDQPIIVFAYAHFGGEEAAEANGEALRALVDSGESVLSDRPWSDVLTVEDIDTDGDVLVARLGLGPDAGLQIAYDILLRRDGLLAHR